VWGEVLLEVKVGDDHAIGRGEEDLELVVEYNLTTVLGVLQPVSRDVGIDELRHLGSRDEIALGKTEEGAERGSDLLLPVETVVRGACLGLFAIGIFLGVLNLAHQLCEVLDVGAECGDFGLNRFEGHYIYSYLLIFKLMRKTIHVTMNITNN